MIALDSDRALFIMTFRDASKHTVERECCLAKNPCPQGDPSTRLAAHDPCPPVSFSPGQSAHAPLPSTSTSNMGFLKRIRGHYETKQHLPAVPGTALDRYALRRVCFVGPIRLLREQREVREQRDRVQQRREQQRAQERICREAFAAERKAIEDEKNRTAVAAYQ